MNLKKLYLAFALTLTSLFSAAFAQLELKPINLLPSGLVEGLIVILFLIIAYELYQAYGPRRGALIAIIVLLYANFVVAPFFNEAIGNASQYSIWSVGNLGQIFGEMLEGDFTNALKVLLYFITPFMLIFLMFYGVLSAIGPFRGQMLWGRSIEGWMAFFLSLLLVPSRYFMGLFSALVGGLAGATVIYLYVGLFFLIFVWGYISFYKRAQMMALPGGLEIKSLEDDQKLRDQIVSQLIGLTSARNALEKNLIFGQLDEKAKEAVQKSFHLNVDKNLKLRKAIDLNVLDQKIRDLKDKMDGLDTRIEKERKDYYKSAMGG